MPLIKCPECGNEISSRVKECPFCGCPSEYFSEQNKESNQTSAEKKTSSDREGVKSVNEEATKKISPENKTDRSIPEQKGKRISIKRMGLLIVSVIGLILIFKALRGDFDKAAEQIGEGNFSLYSEEIQMVRNGHPESYPDTTYGEAFESFFSKPTWDSFVTEDEMDIVEFKGDCRYRDTDVTATIQFTLDKENGSFETTYFALNDIPQTLIELYGLYDSVFEGKADESVTTDHTEEVTEEVIEDNGSLRTDLDAELNNNHPGNTIEFVSDYQSGEGMTIEAISEEIRSNSLYLGLTEADYYYITGHKLSYNDEGKVNGDTVYCDRYYNDPDGLVTYIQHEQMWFYKVLDQWFFGDAASGVIDPGQTQVNMDNLSDTYWKTVKPGMFYGRLLVEGTDYEVGDAFYEEEHKETEAYLHIVEYKDVKRWGNQTRFLPQKEKVVVIPRVDDHYFEERELTTNGIYLTRSGYYIRFNKVNGEMDTDALLYISKKGMEYDTKTTVDGSLIPITKEEYENAMAKAGSVEKSQEITVAEKEDEEKDEEGLNILSQNEEIDPDDDPYAYMNYWDWNGTYYNGESTLSLSFYTDHEAGESCGVIEEMFRGNIFSGEIYYLGDELFRWDPVYANGVSSRYVKMINVQHGPALYVYEPDSDYEVTFLPEG